MDFLTQVPYLQEGLTILGGVYLASSTIATLTPSGKDDKFFTKVGNFFDKIGFNFRLINKKF